MEYSDRDRCFMVRSVHRTDPAVVDRLRSIRIDLDETLVGRAARERRPIAVPDLDTVRLDPHLQILYDDGWRSLAAVPMLREDQIVGVPGRPAQADRRLHRGDPRPAARRFASQSALALLNARLFRELEEQSVELELASTHKSEFLASMSHELRTPLNAVLGFSEVLLERMFGDINERQEEYLRDIHGSGQHLLELLNEILDLSKVEAGRMELEYSSFDLRTLLELRDVDAPGAGGAPRHRPPGRRPTTTWARSTPTSSASSRSCSTWSPTRSSSPATAARSWCAPSAREREVVISVTDTGIGVPEADRERIFESFQQGGRGSSREEGTGLGLTLSRRIVELLGGRMWLDSEVGRGSTFGFSLPAGDREGAGQPIDGTASTTCGEVVVIEDDRPSLDLFSAYLTGAALDVTTARDGPSGLAAVRRTLPDAVLLDIRLPGIDGWAVLKELKAEPATRDIPVIVVSIVDERARGVAMGAAAYLVKPIGREDLLTALAAVGAPVPAAGARRASGGAMSEGAHPRGRGQPEEPQAGAGRADVRRLRGDRGDLRRGRRPARGRARARPHPDGPAAARDRRCRGAAADPGDRATGPGRRRDGVRDERRPHARLRRRLRRLRREADQRAGPAPAGQRLPQARRHAHERHRPVKARVLVVDDQPPNVRLLEAILAPRGYDVRTASSGRGGAGRARRPTTWTWSSSTS